MFKILTKNRRGLLFLDRPVVLWFLIDLHEERDVLSGRVVFLVEFLGGGDVFVYALQPAGCS